METIKVSVNDKLTVKNNVAVYVTLFEYDDLYKLEKDRLDLFDKPFALASELFNRLGEYRSIAIESEDEIKIIASATQLEQIDDLIHQNKTGVL